MRRFLAVALLLLIAAAGCTTNSIGQVVTNVSSDGRGGIIVEKGTLKQRSYMWTYVTDVWIDNVQTISTGLGR
ncbi:MAG: hypothetical protein R6V05_10970 [Candidatus Brocadiia bacterium]